MSGILTYLDTLLSRKQIKGVCVFFQCLAGDILIYLNFLS